MPRLALVAATAMVAAVAINNIDIDVKAAGFALREQSGTALGNAFAGSTAGGDDISYMFFNPATLTLHDGFQTVFTLSGIFPTSEFQGGSATTATGATIEGTATTGDIGDDALVPALYAMWSVAPQWRLGLGINVPFGLSTTYSRDWIGRYHAVDSEVHTVNINPVVAYRVNDMISIGGGVQIQYIDATLTSAIDFGTLGQGVGGTPGSLADDGFADLEGDDWGVGFNLGVMVQPTDDLRIGLAYRSNIEHELEGDADFTLSGVGATVSALTGQFVDTGLSGDLDLPETVSLGVNYRVNDRWEILGEAAWTGWSRFEELRIEFDNPAQADSVTVEDWDDTWFAAIGTTYRPSDDWTLRAGIAYDQAAAPDETRTPRIPDEERYWVSAGASYQPADWVTVSAGYTHIFVNDASIDLTLADTNNLSRGTLSGSYESEIDLVAVQATFRW